MQLSYFVLDTLLLLHSVDSYLWAQSLDLYFQIPPMTAIICLLSQLISVSIFAVSFVVDWWSPTDWSYSLTLSLFPSFPHWMSCYVETVYELMRCFLISIHGNLTQKNPIIPISINRPLWRWDSFDSVLPIWGNVMTSFWTNSFEIAREFAVKWVIWKWLKFKEFYESKI